MPLDLSGFIVDENKWEGLDKLSKGLDQMGEDKRKREAAALKLKQDNRNANATALGSMLNPKDYLTGTLGDPEILKRVDGVMQKGMKLANEGYDPASLKAAIYGDISELNLYSVKAKSLAEQKKEALKFIEKNPSINTQEFAKQWDDIAWFDTDAEGKKKLKDLSSIDPQKPYADEVLKNGDVFTGAGIDNYVAKSKVNPVIQGLTVIGANKSSRKIKAKVSSPNYMISEENAKGEHTGFVPKYEVATDEGVALVHNFQLPEGQKQATVRLLDKEVFTDLPPEAQAYLRQEVRKYAKQAGIKDLSPVQAEQLARAFAYDEIKKSSQQHNYYEEVVEQKAAPIKIYNNNSTGGSKSKEPPTINDVFGDIEEALKGKKPGQHAQVNLLPSMAQDAVLESARKATGVTSVGMGDVMLVQDKNGVAGIYAAKDIKNDKYQLVAKKGTLLRNLNRVGVNLPKQANVAAKVSVVQQGINAVKNVISPKPKTRSKRHEELYGKSMVTGMTEAELKELNKYEKQTGEPLTGRDAITKPTSGSWKDRAKKVN